MVVRIAIAVTSVQDTREHNDLGFQAGELRSSKILARDPKLPHHGIQGRAWHSKAAGRSADHAISLPEDADDIFTFHLR